MAKFREQSNEGRPLSHGDFAAFHKTTPRKRHKKGGRNMLINYNPRGTYSINERGGYEWHRNTQDGHGGRAEEHREEMVQIAEQIAEEKIKAMVPQIVREIYMQSLEDELKGLRYDIETIVEIAFNDGREIFQSSKATKAVSDAIYKEILKGLKDIHVKIKL